MPESRRQYLSLQAGLLLGSTSASSAQPDSRTSAAAAALPSYAKAQDYTCLRQSSYDRSGGNRDSFEIPPGGTQEVFSSAGPGIITHVWFTIAADSNAHLKELVLRIYWDGNDRPSVLTPVGDFFGLNLGEYFLYQS